jgi:hypothetical protein
MYTLSGFDCQSLAGGDDTIRPRRQGRPCSLFYNIGLVSPDISFVATPQSNQTRFRRSQFDADVIRLEIEVARLFLIIHDTKIGKNVPTEHKMPMRS